MNATIAKFASLPKTGVVECLDLSWTDWLEHLARTPDGRFAGDMRHSGWSPAVFDPPARLRENIRSVSALVLDYDKQADWDKIAACWSGSYGLIYTTKRHTEELPRLRVVLPLARPVTADEYDTLWQWGKRVSPCPVDENAKDPSRFWFDPTSPPGAWRAQHLTGSPVSPDEVIALPIPTPPPPLRVVRPAVPHGDVDRIGRAAAYLAKIPGAVSGDSGHTRTFNAVAHVMIGFDLSESDTLTLITSEYNPRCDPPWSERELEHKIKSVAARCNRERGYLLVDRPRVTSTRTAAANAPEIPPEIEVDWRTLLKTKADGTVRKGYHNIAAYVRHHPRYRGKWAVDLMTKMPWLNGEPMDPSHVHAIRDEIDCAFGWTPAAADVEASIVAAAQDRPFHPIMQYLRSLDWDGVERLSAMASDYLGSSSAMHADMVRKFMIGACARALKPGCKLDTVLVLSGEEGYRKSSFFITLGGQWHADSFIDLTGKDGLMQLHSSWLYEFAEIENVLAGRAASRTKSWITSAFDTFRPPYARVTERKARSAIVCGTTNRDRFLTEETGSRRFWIIPVKSKIDHVLLTEMRDQLWAEALCAAEAGEQWWLDEAIERKRAADNEEHVETDSWLEVVSMWLDGRATTTVTEILQVALKLELGRHDRWAQMRAARCLERSGWERVRDPNPPRAYRYRPGQVSQ